MIRRVDEVTKERFKIHKMKNNIEENDPLRTYVD